MLLKNTYFFKDEYYIIIYVDKNKNTILSMYK